jgi:hypothetical protein
MHLLQGLQVRMSNYFEPKVEDFQWLRNPFVASLSEQGLKSEISGYHGGEYEVQILLGYTAV